MQITVENLDKLLRQFDPNEIRVASKAAATATAHEIINVLRVYPPAGAGNRPGRFTANGRPMGYYERTRGYWSPRVNRYSLASFGNFGKSRGVILASKTQRKTGTVAGYKLTASSERLREKWTIKQEPGAVVVTNAASYAPYVQSVKKQSAVMARIGWGTDVDAIKKVVGKRVFERAFYQALRARFLKRG